MKKKVFALLLAVGMIASMTVGCGGTEEGSATQDTTAESTDEAEDEAPAEAVEFDVEGEYDPNPDYDKYTLFEYTIEDAGATFVVTLSAKEDESQFEIHCNFYGDEQLVVVEHEGDEFKVVEDKTGFMETDSPMICQTGMDQNKWAAIE